MFYKHHSSFYLVLGAKFGGSFVKRCSSDVQIKSQSFRTN